MIKAISPALAAVGLGLTILCLCVYAILFCRAARRNAGPRRFLLLLSELLSVAFFVIWGVLLSLGFAGLTFDPVTTLVLRWSVVLLTFVSMLRAFGEHEWAPLLPGICALFSLPFFEDAFGGAFPYVLLALLFAYLLSGLFSLVQSLRSRQVSLRSVQEAVDTVSDGLLFAEQDGTVLLCNRAMRELSTAICHQPLTNANVFWDILQQTASNDRITKVEAEGNFLFRFTTGDTWTFHRAQIASGSTTYFQVVALNISESDETQRLIVAAQGELDRTALQLKQLEETIEKLREQESRVHQGRLVFDSITEKMAALYRFFAEHYALPAETFDYKKLSDLTVGLLQELQNVPTLLPAESISLTIGALRLLGVDVAISGTLPGNQASDTAIAAIIREAAVNAMVHGAATSLTIAMEPRDGAFHCIIQNSGIPHEGTLAPGGGMTLMRRLLFPLGGTLEIEKEPQFSLAIRIPFTP